MSVSLCADLPRVCFSYDWPFLISFVILGYVGFAFYMILFVLDNFTCVNDAPLEDAERKERVLFAKFVCLLALLSLLRVIVACAGRSM